MGVVQSVQRALGAGRTAVPKLYMSEKNYNHDVLAKCQTVLQKYQVKRWLWNGHVETIFAAKFRKCPNLQYNRECLRMSDGGTVAVDFEPVEFDKGLRKDAPVLILLPGLTGGSHDSYVEYAVIAARLVGIRAIVFNGRGCGNAPVTTAQFYSASFTGDLREVVERVRHWYPQSTLFAAGWSLGANILVNYLGEEGEKTPVQAAVSLCNPFNLVLSDKNFSNGFNRIYDISLALGLRRLLKAVTDVFEGNKDIDLQRGLKCWSIREFDDAITRKTFGWPSVDAYYAGSCSSDAIPKVKIPLLCIQAADDPIAPDFATPYEAIQQNELCALIVTPAGGHLGWVSGPGAPFGGPWSDLITTEYFKAILDKLNEQQPKAALMTSLSEL